MKIFNATTDLISYFTENGMAEDVAGATTLGLLEGTLSEVLSEDTQAKIAEILLQFKSDTVVQMMLEKLDNNRNN